MKNSEIKYKPLFFPEKESTKPDGKLRLRLRWSDCIVNFNLGYRVHHEKWDKVNQRCNANTFHGKTSAREINATIQDAENLIDDIFKKYEVAKSIPTVDQLRYEFNIGMGRVVKANEVPVISIFDRIDEFILEESKNNGWKRSTCQKFEGMKNHFIDFEKYEKTIPGGKLTFNYFDKTGISKYMAFIQDKKMMINSTALKQLSFVKWFLRWAIDKGYTSNDGFNKYKPKLERGKKTVVFLTWNELMKVFHFDFMHKLKTLPDELTRPLYENEVEALERVRDVFCFCCFTSLRYSDVENLKKSDIKDNEFTFTSIKTGDTLTIELNKYSKAILAKYRDSVLPGGKALPVISNQKMNDHLKEMGEICGLNQLITQTYFRGSERIDEVRPKYELLGTHCGRRTFICNALMLGIPAEIVMKWTGHSDYKSMQPYIEVADDAKKQAMNKFNTRSKRKL